MKKLTGARILGISGFIAGSLGMIGGFADIPVMFGIANAIMMASNLLVSVRKAP